MKNNVFIEVNTLYSLFGFNGIYYKDLNTKNFVQTPYHTIKELNKYLHTIYPEYDEIFFIEKIKDRRQWEWDNTYILK